jgi:hypothetical protein
MLQSGRSRGPLRMKSLIFLNGPNLSIRTDPGVDSASNTNEYQEFSWGLKRDRRVRLAISPSSMELISRKSYNLMGLHGLLQR